MPDEHMMNTSGNNGDGWSPTNGQPASGGPKGMEFGLIFFSASEPGGAGDAYRLVIEAAKFADRHGFSAVWIPERHFTKDGHLYPNPAVIQAALARETEHVHLRAGSVVLPLHHPARVAEEWAVVDNLSGGRVGISFASGWHPNDFALAPDRYAERHVAMVEGIQAVRKLWRGEPITAVNGEGKPVELRTFPRPVQPELPVWVTAAGNPRTFAAAGEIGAHVLTHLFNQGAEELAEKIEIYRNALRRNGHDPNAGHVAVMVHSFVVGDAADVAAKVRPAFASYLESASYLLDAIASSRGQKIDLCRMSRADIEDYARFVFDRLVSSGRVLFGTPETCSELVTRLRSAGVDELACQLDFGVDVDSTLESLTHLNRLKERCNPDAVPASNGVAKPRRAGVTSLAGPRSENAAGGPDVLDGVRDHCRDEVDGADFYERLRARGVEFEGAFRGVERLWRGQSEALGLVRVPDDVAEEAARYHAHPAFLDACFQVILGALPDDAASGQGGALFLPTGLGEFRVVGRPGGRVWSHARLRPVPGTSADVCEGDVHIYDEAGTLVAEALGLRLRSAGREPSQDAAPDPSRDWLYELRWRPADRAPEPTAPKPASAGAWLIFADGQGVGDGLATVLEGRGASCTLVRPGDGFALEGAGRFRVDPGRPEDVGRLLEAVQQGEGDRPPWRGLVHLWSLDAPTPSPADATDPSFLEAAGRIGCGSVLTLVQGLARVEWSEPPRLWLVTRGGQALSTEPTPLAVAQAPLWGFGRALALEHPDLWGGLVDLDPGAGSSEDAARLLASELLDPDGEDQLAFRRGARFVARLARHAPVAEPSRPVNWRPDASYLITGGLGDLGLQVARWMAAQGARHLILLGRTALPPRALWDRLGPDSPAGRRVAAVIELERSGATVYPVAADVADPGQMQAVLERARAEGWPPIRGVVHTAAEIHGGTLLTLDADSVGRVLRPKVAGGWVLDRLLGDEPLDFFVLFSSIPALLGWFGQGAANYAAANAFLDALAHDRRARGRPALSINWGAWGEVGLTARAPGGLDRLAQQGMGGIPPARGVEVFGRLLAGAAPEVAVAAIHWPEFFQAWPLAASAPVLAELAREAATAPVNGRAAPGGEAGDRIRAAAPGERRALVEAHLRGVVARVLGLTPDRLDAQRPLVDLGLDSLMAIELKNRIEVDLGVRLSMVELLKGPTVDQLIGRLVGQLASAESAPPRPVAPPPATPDPRPTNRTAPDTEWEVLTI
jgi:natural product biosynthesis luciferase-like monooxygenase protein